MKKQVDTKEFREFLRLENQHCLWCKKMPEEVKTSIGATGNIYCEVKCSCGIRYKLNILDLPNYQ